MTTPFSRPDAQTEFGSAPIEIAPDLWWVGSRLEGDPFQCHSYLLVRGDQSVLFDPGSVLTWPETRRKIGELIDFDDIRWFVVHHQDPDICGAMPEIDREITRDDAFWVTHWRVAVMVKHYGPKTPFWLVNENEWMLDLGGRTLQFIFTPYAHFPGAFTTFDPLTGTLLSSDLFGGFSTGKHMYSTGLDDFEGIRDFHEHYMPSHDILLDTMLKFEAYPIEMIAPQHGKLIIGDNIKLYINRLKNLDCGLYLLSQSNSDIRYLHALNNLLRDTIATIANEREFRVIATHMFGEIGKFLPLVSADLVCRFGDEHAMWISSSGRFRGSKIDLPEGLRDATATEADWSREATAEVIAGGLPIEVCDNSLTIPLFGSDGGELIGVAILTMEPGFESTPEFDEVLSHVASPISVAVEREMINRLLDEERQTMYQRSIRDPLTNLFTRRYLDDTAHRMIEVQRRNPHSGFAVVMADIDHFKSVNDESGHLAGDEVLRAVSGVLGSVCRKADTAARFGGEEFVVLMPLTSLDEAVVLAERIRSRVEAAHTLTNSGQISVTISLGVAIHHPAETLADTIKKADTAMYEAKATGRNKVCISVD